MTIEYDHQAQMAQVSFDQLLNFELVTVSVLITRYCLIQPNRNYSAPLLSNYWITNYLYRKLFPIIIISVTNDSTSASNPRIQHSLLADDATLIMVNLFIRSFAKIDDVKMEYSVQITFRQKWSDDRLTYKHRLTGDMQSKSDNRHRDGER